VISDDVKTALISVLKDIQARSGLACPDLRGTDVPPRVLEKFDSTVWPAATTLIARKLGIIIPNDVHIFGGERGTRLLTIDQSSELIMQKHQLKAPMRGAA
jgi:hypothetical protein